VLPEACVGEAPVEVVVRIADVGHVEQRVEHVLGGQARLAVALQLVDLAGVAFLVLA
jgi:hypothetical protein